ncbi:hypothetical protein L486_02870 [Kwoniella mangroviensis CBS 10435]|uniref:Ig-like domain-containing protein n=1 Tax=Kwoniella mangroviensis CBS 10435 TaxID=1331196 RepID=A0A1B9IXD1_9TREE|nr:hypothetical protein L486_02870 [Kwoniella mangroviensis CBS 10435]
MLKSSLIALVTLLGPSSVQAQSSPKYLTSNTGVQWPLYIAEVSGSYSQAPSSDGSQTNADELYVVCNWQDPSNSGNYFGCRYDGAASTGSKFSSGRLWNGGGTYSSQSCPTIDSDKPRPSPGVSYRKRDVQASQFVCPTQQADAEDPVFLTYFDAMVRDGTLQYANEACPTQLCQAAQPYTRRRRGLPQPAYTRQTSRQQIVARRKKIAQRESARA